MRTLPIRKEIAQWICLGITAIIGFILLQSPVLYAVDEMKETALFTFDPTKQEVLAPPEKVKEYLKLSFISVTTDQPIYWPNETVYLKVLLPLMSLGEVDVTLFKRDATPRELGRFTLNDGGILVQEILSGKERRMEIGEYRVEVSTTDKRVQSAATFSIVEGTLGAVSFAYDFQEITDPRELEKVKGGWYLGNASGIGKRWGNGLNVKNEVRVSNEPYTGEITIKSRCYLPGCDGIEAGPPIIMAISNGSLEAVLDISSHSGPFEIEVITGKGSVKHLFGKSGHAERESVPISSNLTNKFRATMAPYEGTTPVEGRGIYVAREGEEKEDAVELPSAICDSSNQVSLTVKEELLNARLFLYSPRKGNEFESREMRLDKRLTSGTRIGIACSSPYTFISLGGFKGSTKDFYEGWAILFTPSPLDIGIDAPQMGAPLSRIEIGIRTFEKGTGKGIPTYGILEVFDNRVPSRSPSEPLVSSIGDSYREVSNYLSIWMDRTGLKAMEEENLIAAVREVQPSPPSSMVMYEMDFAMLSSAPSTGGPIHKFFAPAYLAEEGFTGSGGEHAEGIRELIREGERKVVYCGLVKTDASGLTRVGVELPPQTGRCKARFVAVSGYDYREGTQDIDVSKDDYAEVHIQPLLVPKARVLASVAVVNNEKENLILQLSGGGMEKGLSFDIQPGRQEIGFEVRGENYGKLQVLLVDSKGKTRDIREIAIRDISGMQVTFSGVIVSDGLPIRIEKGRRVAVYSNPARLLQGMVTNVVTTMYSWFGHSEALSASCAVRAMLLRAMEEGIIGTEGLRDGIKGDLTRCVKDLHEVFFDQESGLVRPYPGIEGKPLWSLWVSKNLGSMLNALNGNENLTEEFGDTISKARAMAGRINEELKERGIPGEDAFFNPDAGGVDVIPIEVEGKVVYRAITDEAVVQWYVQKMIPLLDLPACKGIEDLSKRIVISCDTYRFLKAFERTGPLYYLLLNAQALYLKRDGNFYPLFNRIAKGMIATQDPGMIKGPALLGGVYSSPQTLIKFLDLMLLMARDEKLFTTAKIEVSAGKETKEMSVADGPLLLDAMDAAITVRGPEFVTLRINEEKWIDLYEYLSEKPFFTAGITTNEMKMGDEGDIVIELEGERDPTEYYAIVAAPSVLSIRQTEDLLSDYKGQLIYGQRGGGGEKIQLLTLPFRGSRRMVLKTEAAIKGISEGYVLVRHMSNPDIIATVRIGGVTVR